MGNCSSPAVGKMPSAPVPNIDPKKCGMNKQEVRAVEAYEAMKELYTQKKNALMSDDKRSTDEKKPEAVHKDAFEDAKVQEKASQIASALDRKFNLTREATKLQKEQLDQMEDNPEKDMPGPMKSGWEKAKKAAIEKAVKTAINKALGESLDESKKDDEEGEAAGETPADAAQS